MLCDVLHLRVEAVQLVNADLSNDGPLQVHQHADAAQHGAAPQDAHINVLS